MIRTVKYFGRGDQILVVDTTSGQRVVHYVPKGPGALRKAANVARAAIKHQRSGRPLASDADVQTRWSVCSAATCGFFLPFTEGHGRCQHPTCGCNLFDAGHESRSLPNKLRWADQDCPIGLWPALVQITPPRQRTGGCGGC